MARKSQLMFVQVPEELTLDGNEAGSVLGRESLEGVHGGIPIVECQ